VGTTALGCATCLVVLAILPISGGLLPWDGPSSDHSAPLFFPSAPPAPHRGSQDVLIVEVYYRAVRDDEYIVVGNSGAAAVDLSGWTVTDLEGSASFPEGTVLPPRGEVVVTRNATSFAEDTLRRADFTYDRGDAPRMAVVRIPRLANDGDEVLLRDRSGAVVDAVAWGDSRYAGPGWSGPPADVVSRGHRMVRASLAAAWTDTDLAADWNALRPYALGQVDRPLTPFTAESVTPFLSPDDAQSVLSHLLRAAHRSAYVAVYEFTSEYLATELEAAARRGVDVRVLLDGSPVGGLETREWSIARNLSAAGAGVRFLAGDLDAGVVARYRFLHAKYAMLDNETAVVGSENWGLHGFPPPSVPGNRGWHLAVRDPELARYLAETFLRDYDSGRRDSVDLTGLRPRVVSSYGEGTWGVRNGLIPARTIFGPIHVVPVLGPDHTLRDDTVLGALRSAVHSIDVEVLMADTRWGDAPNPYVDAIVAAARRGVRVRLLLDGSDFGSKGGDPLGNRATVSSLNGIARAEALPLEVRQFPPGADGIVKVHAKGLIVDGRLAFASSLNWNRNSATRNREVGLLVDSLEVAEFFEGAFESDWAAAEDPRMIPLTGLAAPLVIVAGSSAAVWFFIRRRRTKQL